MLLTTTITSSRNKIWKRNTGWEICLADLRSSVAMVDSCSSVVDDVVCVGGVVKELQLHLVLGTVQILEDVSSVVQANIQLLLRPG